MERPHGKVFGHTLPPHVRSLQQDRSPSLLATQLGEEPRLHPKLMAKHWQKKPCCVLQSSLAAQPACCPPIVQLRTGQTGEQWTEPIAL